MLHGVNPFAPILMRVLDLDSNKGVVYPKNAEGKEWYPYDDGLTPEGEKYIAECIEKRQYPSGRFRDIYINEDGSEITLYTRNGGGNRESYFYVFDILSKHPNYLRDYDDDFDSTYAYIVFSVPEEAKELVSGLVTGEKPETIHEKFQQTMMEMEKMSKEDFVKDERFKPMAEMFEKIADPENEQKVFEV